MYNALQWHSLNTPWRASHAILFIQKIKHLVDNEMLLVYHHNYLYVQYVLIICLSYVSLLPSVWAVGDWVTIQWMLGVNKFWEGPSYFLGSREEKNAPDCCMLWNTRGNDVGICSNIGWSWRVYVSGTQMSLNRTQRQSLTIRAWRAQCSNPP